MSRAVPGARTLRAVRFLAGLLLAAAASGCMKGEVGGLLPPPITHPDLDCNTAPAAVTNPDCRLQLGTERTEYIQQSNDKDWWVVNVGTLPARAIVHVVAGYKPGAGQDAGTFNTAVNFQINVLDSNNGVVGTSLATGVDLHGSNPPTMLDLTFRYTKSNNDLFLLVQDDTGRKVDNLSPYSIFVEVVADPDANEPNDTAGHGHSHPAHLGRQRRAGQQRRVPRHAGGRGLLLDRRREPELGDVARRGAGLHHHLSPAAPVPAGVLPARPERRGGGHRLRRRRLAGE